MPELLGPLERLQLVRWRDYRRHQSRRDARLVPESSEPIGTLPKLAVWLRPSAACGRLVSTQTPIISGDEPVEETDLFSTNE